MNRITNSVLKSLLSLLVFLQLSTSFAGQELVLAVHPFLSHEEVEKKFTPLAKYITGKTGISIKVRVGSTYQEHIDYIGLNHVDIAYMGPASYVYMTEEFGQKPVLARLEVNGNSYFKGNIVVRSDSNITTLDELRGRQIAFGDPSSTMSYIVPHYMLHMAGIFDDKSTKHQFLHSHTNVALSVLSGDFDAGAVKPAVFKKFEKDGLRVLAETPKISEHLFVAKSNLDNITVRKIRETLLGMKDSKEGIAALREIKPSITGLTRASNADYDNLRKIIQESQHFHR